MRLNQARRTQGPRRFKSYLALEKKYDSLPPSLPTYQERFEGVLVGLCYILSYVNVTKTYISLFYLLLWVQSVIRRYAIVCLPPAIVFWVMAYHSGASIMATRELVASKMGIKVSFGR
ncbi:hypothetical protein ACSBR2_041285 [Camellia fascicularis]